MEMPMLRSLHHASGIFQGNFSDCSTFNGSEYQTNVLSRRLVGSESTKKTVVARSREMPESSGSTRLYNKQREIRTDSQTRDCLHRGCFPLKAMNSNSNSREIKKVRFSSTKVTLGPKSSQKFSTSTRPNGFMSGINSQWPTFHETHTITPVSFLASSINGPRSCGSHYATSKIASSVVVRSSQHHEGSLFATGLYTDNHSHGCNKTRLWGHVGKDLIHGTWSKSQSELHINLLELEAVFLTVKHFLPVLKNKNVLIRSDSTTVWQYVNRQGGTKSPPLCYRIWDLWNCSKNNMHLKQCTYREL